MHKHAGDLDLSNDRSRRFCIPPSAWIPRFNRLTHRHEPRPPLIPRPYSAIEPRSNREEPTRRSSTTDDEEDTSESSCFEFAIGTILRADTSNNREATPDKSRGQCRCAISRRRESPGENDRDFESPVTKRRKRKGKYSVPGIRDKTQSSHRV